MQSAGRLREVRRPFDNLGQQFPVAARSRLPEPAARRSSPARKPVRPRNAITHLLITSGDLSSPEVKARLRQFVPDAVTVIANRQTAFALLPQMPTPSPLTPWISSFALSHVDVSRKGNTQRNLPCKTCLAERLRIVKGRALEPIVDGLVEQEVGALMDTSMVSVR